MKSKIYEFLMAQGVRISLCVMVLSFNVNAFAQDDLGEDDTTIKAPKKTAKVVKYPTVTITGTVVDEATKSPVAGVRLHALGYEAYSGMTNAEGKFTIAVPTFATALYVQAPRYMAQQVAIKSNEEKQYVYISLLSDKFKAMYDESTKYTAKNSFKPVGNTLVIDEEIQRNLGADVRSVARSGNVVNGNAMFIRGLNSLNANSQPLIFVDGVEQDMQLDRTTLHSGNFINGLASFSPEDIESVEVLKNATALYGARGANGVILITTKRGHSMATRIDVNVSAGITAVPSTPSMLNASQYTTYATEMLGTMDVMKIDANKNINFNFLNNDQTNFYYHMYHNDTDWKKEVYHTAITQNYNINVQGGDDIGMYNLSVGYMDAGGSIKNTSFNRLNVRFNTDVKILWNLSTKFDMSLSRTNQFVFNDGFLQNFTQSAITSPSALASIKSPLLAPYQYNSVINGFTSLLSEADDLFGQIGNEYSLANPAAVIVNGEGDNKNKVENTYYNVRVEPKFDFSPNLSVSSMFSYTLNRNSQRYYRPYTGVPAFTVAGLGTVTSMTASLFAKYANIVSDTHIDWRKVYDAHQVYVKGGFRFNRFSYDANDLSTQYTGETNDKNPSLSSSSGYPSVSGNNDVWKNMQWYATSDYSYKNRYFATISLLAEANSRFGTSAKSTMKLFGTRWAVYPSIQLGWVMTNEDWFPKTKAINYLRVNAGFDVSGNDGISNYAAKTSFSPVRYNFTAIGMQMDNIGNEEIKAETTQKWNLGFQTNMLNNRLSIGFDYYIHKTSDLLTLQTFKNPVGGINNYWVNGGSLKNTGFEFGISCKPVVMKDLTVEVGATMGHYKNKLTSLPTRVFTDGIRTFNDGTYCASVYGNNNILVAEGNPIGMFYGYQTRGVFSSDDAARAAAAEAGKDDYLFITDAAGTRNYYKAGDVHFVDQNGDGEINEKDKVVIGDPNPDIYGNLFAVANWKRFTFSMTFNYCIGNDVYNYQRSILNSGATLYNQQVAEVGRWRYEGQNTTLPKLAYGDPMGNNRFSDRWIEDGSYLRLKNLRIAYQIPVPESWQSWLQGITVWGEAQNLFTITKYTGEDPEFSVGNSTLYQGVDCGNIAQSRRFLLGLKINL